MSKQNKTLKELLADAKKDSPMNNKSNRQIIATVSNATNALNPLWKEAQQRGAQKKYEKDKNYNKKRSETLRKTKGRKIVTPFGEYDNVVAYREDNPKSKPFADNRRIKPHLYYFKDEGPGEPLYESVLYSPYGKMPKLDTYLGGKKRMYDLCRSHNDKLALKYNDYLAWWKKASTQFPDQFYEQNDIKIEWLLYDK